MKRFYYAIQNVVDFLVEKYKGKRILEIGPGNITFPIATHTIDLIDRPDKINVKMDICFSPLPFPDNYFDFTYCRHVMEDTNNPIYPIKEIIRVSKAFYIETPSPLVESSKHIEFYSGKNPDSKHYGYMHHRFIVWYNNEKNEINLLPKLPIIEHLNFQTDKSLLDNPIYWNTYIYIDKSIRKIPTVNNYIPKITFLPSIDYSKVIIQGVNENIISTNYFYSNTLQINNGIKTIYTMDDCKQYSFFS